MAKLSPQMERVLDNIRRGADPREGIEVTHFQSVASTISALRRRRLIVAGRDERGLHRWEVTS